MSPMSAFILSSGNAHGNDNNIDYAGGIGSAIYVRDMINAIDPCVRILPLGSPQRLLVQSAPAPLDASRISHVRSTPLHPSLKAKY